MILTLICLWLFIAGFVAWLVASVLAAESARYDEPVPVNPAQQARERLKGNAPEGKVTP